MTEKSSFFTELNRRNVYKVAGAFRLAFQSANPND